LRNKLTKYIYDRFEFTEKYKNEVIEILKPLTNIEIGGTRFFDGSRTHLMQNPYEWSDFLFALKKHEKERGKKLSTFLEIGFSCGINNTLLHKFFKFDEIVGIDMYSPPIHAGGALVANMARKNLTLLCRDTTLNSTINIAGKLGPYDLIFIDANHTYEFGKQDFYNYEPFLSDGGVIAFHDIDCPEHPGIKKFWNELRETGKYNQQEFVCRDYLLQYGIGMLTIK
jgi:hypothetical protein